ncbi:MAG: hypothetical protein M1818_005282 [Claussenomyces sp. TS43310]|nr:MAG: hypothetical protein M1818_005282 [Claussenomyces sp. TS43310]
MAEEPQSGVFDGCVVSVALSKELPQESALKASLCETLEQNGAEIVDLKTDGSIRIDHVTHIISANVDFPQYNLAFDQMINVVRPAWVATSLLKNKQVPMRPFTPDPRLIFSGINITTADIPTCDKDAIIGAVLAMGGQETSSLTKLVTHIVALTDEHPKVQQALEKKLKCKVVLPHWFDDCLRLGQRIDERPYLLPDPEVLRMRADENVNIPASQHIEGATSTRPDFLATPTDSPIASRRHLHVFNEKTIMLADDLSLGSRLRGIIEDLIEGGGGTITGAIHKADIYVCHYREGRNYITASRSGKDVGNLSWLYHLITHNQWTSPFRRLMHYPIPRDGIPGFQDCRITLSNYGGEARMYLENLVTAAGGEFTKSMRQDNTHLITARKNSEKCQAAQEWNINMINHLWIEESYAQCKLQSLTNPRYTHFPARTNLGEIIGQTQFDRNALETLYFPRDPTDSPEQIRNPRMAMRAKDQNLLFTTAAKQASSASDSEPAQEISDAATWPMSEYSGVATPSRRVPPVSTPFGKRLTYTGKENETPSSGSRSAKDRALSRLHDLAPDVALYEKEKKRGAGNGVWGGKRAADQIDRERNEENGRKRTASPLASGGDEDTEPADSEGNEAKRQKTGRPVVPQVQMRLLITSYGRWTRAREKEDSDRHKLRQLGILVVQDPATCTHLAAPSMIRTQKFLTALATGPVVLSTDFIDTCLEGHAAPSTEDFLLKDPQNEKRLKLKLKEVVRRAKSNPRRLLGGIVVYCTTEIQNGPETYKAIVEANGGTFVIYRGRRGNLVKLAEAEDDEEEEEEPVYLLSGTRPEEKRLWPKFTQMAQDSHMEPRIVLTEWLLDTAMAQKLMWGDKYLASSE